MKLTRAEYDAVQSDLAEGFHTAFRKASDHPLADKIWKLIRDLPSDEWGHVVTFVMEGTFGERPALKKEAKQKH